MVANRVCTTDCSSANGSATTWSARPVMGVPGSPMMATVGVWPRTWSSSWSTSVVVPDRLMATIMS